MPVWGGKCVPLEYAEPLTLCCCGCAERDEHSPTWGQKSPNSVTADVLALEIEDEGNEKNWEEDGDGFKRVESAGKQGGGEGSHIVIKRVKSTEGPVVRAKGLASHALSLYRCISFLKPDSRFKGFGLARSSQSGCSTNNQISCLLCEHAASVDEGNSHWPVRFTMMPLRCCPGEMDAYCNHMDASAGHVPLSDTSSDLLPELQPGTAGAVGSEERAGQEIWHSLVPGVVEEEAEEEERAEEGEKTDSIAALGQTIPRKTSNVRHGSSMSLPLKNNRGSSISLPRNDSSSSVMDEEIVRS